MSDAFTVTVDLPEGMLEQMRHRAKELQFHDLQFYIRWLVARDVAPQSADAELLTALIHEGESSELIEATESFFSELRGKFDAILAAKSVQPTERAAG